MGLDVSLSWEEDCAGDRGSSGRIVDVVFALRGVGDSSSPETI